MSAAGHQQDPVTSPAQDHPEQPALVLETGSIAVRLRHELVERLEVEHRLRAGEAREVPLHRADDDHRMELAADSAVGRQDLDGIRVASFPGREPGTSLAGVERGEERLDRGIRGRTSLGDGGGERHDGIELVPGPCGGVALVDQSA